MKEEKIYLQPGRFVYQGILELMDAQNTGAIKGSNASDSVRFSVTMFDMRWDSRFSVSPFPTDRSRCITALEVMPDEEGEDEESKENLRCLADYVIRREFAMLDAMLLIGTPNEAVFVAIRSEPT